MAAPPQERTVSQPLPPLPYTPPQALQGEAKSKYFEHAGALLTADGTDDDLVKFEGAPAGYKVVLK